MTDESFALAWSHYRRNPDAHGFFLGANLFLYASWNLSTIAGYLVSQAAPALTGLGLDLVFPLLFLAILVSITSATSEAFAAAAGLAVALIGRKWIPSEWMIPIAGLAAAMIGPGVERLTKNRAPRDAPSSDADSPSGERGGRP